MARSTLIIYEPLDRFRDKQNYWSTYISFYEQYWDSPSSPRGVWFGREYDEFRESLAIQLDVDPELIEDCFFIRDERGSHYLAPIGSTITPHLLISENHIPMEWFLLFKDEERKFLYTHTGFGAIQCDGIYYDSKVNRSRERLEAAYLTLNDVLKNYKGPDSQSFSLFPRLKQLRTGVANLQTWLGGFDQSGYVILDYGELNGLINPQAMQNERSVKEIWDLLSYVKDGQMAEAISVMSVTFEKWEIIRRKASGSSEKFTIQ
ncbi:MAG TPA: hypothetical protein VNN20_08480 [Thermodesulfobacteriota bacterium]|nr:hypothetical protein [Thermodesulfobacteriota bacterium]